MKTSAALMIFLVASWELEILGEIQVITTGWNFFHWTATGGTEAFIAFSLWLLLVWLMLSLLRRKYLRLKQGARRPSGLEQRRLETALGALERAKPNVTRPGRILIADGVGLRMHWIGSVLVVDRPLLLRRHLQALLAHELGHVNHEERMARRLFGMLPARVALVLTLVGLPMGIGGLLLYPAWQWYYRERIFAADRYAVALDQGQALIEALDDLYLPLDKVTRFGRWLKPAPCIEMRIHRLQQAVAASVPAEQRII